MNNKFKNIINNLKIHPYYDVPPCPSCGSKRTGYFLKRSRIDDDNRWVVNGALTNGEIVSLVDEKGDDDYFCLDCDYTWPGFLRMKLVSKSYIKEQIEERSTKEILEEINKEEDDDKEEGKKKKKPGIFSGVIDSVSVIPIPKKKKT